MSELERRLDAVAATTGFSGVVRLDSAGGTQLVKAYGLADRAHALPMTLDSQLGIASGSKTMTALVVMALVEQGALSLTTTARKFLGDDLPLVADDVTVEHLLAHRSGIGDYLDEEVEPTSEYPMPVSVALLATTEQFLRVLDGHPTKFKAGERFSYCNGGYVVLALIAERASGTGYHTLVRDLVCAPAGMTDTDFHRSDSLPARAALGYVQVDGHWRTNVFHLPVVGNGDGGVYTTVADVHRLWDAVFDGRVVSADALQEMLRPRAAGDGPWAGRTYGLGFWLATGSAVMLNGCDAGASFRSVRDRSSGVTYTVMSNTDSGAWPMAEVLASS